MSIFTLFFSKKIALILQLVQSSATHDAAVDHSVAGVTTGDAAAVNSADSVESAQAQVQVQHGYDNAEATAKMFLESFIDRCGRKKDEGDFRSLLENLIEDLLRTLYSPEWPCTESLVYALVLMMIKAKDQHSEPTMRMLAVTALGSIAAKLREKSVPQSEDEEDTATANPEQVKALHCSPHFKETCYSICMLITITVDV